MKRNNLLIGAALAAPLLAAASFSVSSSAQAQAAVQPSNPMQAEAHTRLDKKQLHNVSVSVENDVATLTGTVDLFAYKAEAGKLAARTHGVTSVRNLIEVGGPAIADPELEDKLMRKLMYDRVGYGNMFNAIALHVEGGVVTLAGHARTEVDRDSAVALVDYMPGVKGLVDQVQIDPVSLMDDRMRMAVARAVYGYPTLNRYALDPAKPIRISVQNGNVELYGMVDSKSDRDIAYLRANGVGGVFSVTNYLVVAESSRARQ
ncbi:BON domain-containing protein [Telmatobacter bradus]|uniref:BON domain-containing protein n=1 Tax=Telmatobacter bradus TaxID=474953 RepID=UPI003B42C3D4